MMMSSDKEYKKNTSFFAKPWLVVVNCASVTLLLRYVLADNSSFIYVMTSVIALIILLVTNVRLLKNQPESHTTFFENKKTTGKQQFFFVSIVIAVFVVNSLRYYDIMPVILTGEANSVSFKADLLISYWQISPLQFLKNVTHPATYNWGLSVIYAPLKFLLGDAQSTIKLFMILVWAGILMLMLWTFTAWHKMHGVVVLLLTPAIVNAATLLSVRTYKWQLMSALSCSVIYFLIKQLQAGENTHIKKGAVLFGGILMAFCILTYHATIVYIPIMLAIMIVNVFYHRKTVNRKAVVIVGVFIVVGMLLLIKTNALAFLTTRFNDVVIHNMEETTLIGNIYSFFSLCLMHGTSWPMAIMFLLGLSAGFARWKTDSAGRTILTAFFMLFALLLVSYGLTNLDENAYIVVFITAIILLGVKEFYAMMLQYLKPGLCVPMAIVLSVFMTVLEAQQIYTIDIANSIFIHNGKAYPYENNKAMYLVMDIKKRENAVIYFPDKSLRSGDGGFDDADEVYDQPETALILKKARPFTLMNKLKAEVMAQLKREPRIPILIYYNNWVFDLKEILGEWEDGITVESIMAPYPDVWIRGEKLSYLAIYNTGQKPAIWPSPHFYVAPDKQEAMIDRVRRLARIIRGNDSSNYF